MSSLGIEQVEQNIKLRCWFTEPSEVDSGSSFQRTIGRNSTRSARLDHQIPEFPLTLVRNKAAFNRFCTEQLQDLPGKIGDFSDLHLDLVPLGGTQRVLLPPVIHGTTCSSLPTESVSDLAKVIAEIADIHWSALQAYRVENIALLESTGMTDHALQAVYRWFWASKDGPNRHPVTTDSLLVEEYLQLAMNARHSGNNKMTSQYSKIAFDLSTNESIDHKIMSDFGDFTDHWSDSVVIKENSVKKVATAAREGIAEHWRFAYAKYYKRGFITPLTEELADYFSSNEPEEEREKLLCRNSSNPYRRGLELVEAVEKGLGIFPLQIWGTITEWPLESLRLRVPVYVVERIQSDSPLAPDLRAERLAELSERAIGKLSTLPSSADIVPRLYDIHKHLDDSLPGTMTSALCQLDIEKESAS